jgi:glycosyltransferase involved in cell wall biosynthesis
MISAFMLVRNGLRLGYPFVEAIASGLPVADEFLIADASSDDGTSQVLESVARRDSRIRIFRDPWDSRSRNGSAIRNALNRVRERARGDYLFQIDASEILPPEDVPRIRELPTLYPEKELFALPYCQFMGRLLFAQEFRFRFAKNRPNIRALYDGWTLGYRLGPRDLTRPRELRRLLARAALRLGQDRIALDMPEQFVYLPRPVFRYYGLFPGAFAAKMGSKEDLQNNPNYRALEAGLRGGAPRSLTPEEYDAFWEAVWRLHADAQARRRYALNKEVQRKEYVPTDAHPEIVRPQLGRDRYEVRPEVLGAGT